MLNLNDYFNQKYVREFLAALRKQGCEHLLDLGCGAKPFAGAYSSIFGRVTCADIEVRSDGVDVIADVQGLPFKDGSFDAVLFSEVIEHVESADEAIRELNRILRPGGALILTFPFMYRMHELPMDFRRYTEFGIDKILRENGFRVTQLRRRGGLFSLAWMLAANVLHGLVTALQRIPVIGVIFVPVRWLAERLLEFASMGIASVAVNFAAMRPAAAGDRLNGFGGYLAAWTLGYCILTEKAHSA